MFGALDNDSPMASSRKEEQQVPQTRRSEAETEGGEAASPKCCRLFHLPRGKAGLNRGIGRPTPVSEAPIVTG